MSSDARHKVAGTMRTARIERNKSMIPLTTSIGCSGQLAESVSTSFEVVCVEVRVLAHRPIWTVLSVPKLAFPDMLVVIEVEAYRGKQ
ncbi:hypothetical protein E4T50_03486 [Aureobasidium sp. EXF-12298]|nr:hypothetical protein E4T50_03486 [Aureobasidium sp. EXF-12298]